MVTGYGPPKASTQWDNSKINEKMNIIAFEFASTPVPATSFGIADEDVRKSLSNIHDQ